MRRNSVTRMICWFALLLVSAGGAVVDAEETVGKNPGKFKGRWLKVYDREALKSFEVVVIGETTTDIAWKKASNEAPLQERELNAQLREQLHERLSNSGLYGSVLSEPEATNEGNYMRVDCELEVVADLLAKTMRRPSAPAMATNSAALASVNLSHILILDNDFRTRHEPLSPAREAGRVCGPDARVPRTAHLSRRQPAERRGACGPAASTGSSPTSSAPRRRGCPPRPAPPGSRCRASCSSTGR